MHVVDTAEQLRLAYDGSNYAEFTVGSSGALDISMTGSAREIIVQLNTNERMRLGNNNVQWSVDSIPASDNLYTCGALSQRWSLVRGVTITSGDLRFENNLVLTEHYNVGEGVPRGLALIDDRDASSPRLLAFFADDGTFYASSVKPLSELGGKIKLASASERNGRSLRELERLNK